MIQFLVNLSDSLSHCHSSVSHQMDELVRQCLAFVLTNLYEVCSLKHDLTSLPPDIFTQLAKV